MRNAIAVARRELQEKRFTLWASLAFGFVPFVALAVIPSLRREAKDFVVIFSDLLAINIPIAIALGLGTTMIGSDLTAGRLSFYFSKPISARALWYGKLIAAIAIAWASIVLAGAPGTLYTWNYRSGEWIDRRIVVVLAIVVPPVLVVLTHALSTMFRTRSAALIADAIGLGAAILGIWLVLKPLREAFAAGMAFVVSIAIGIGIAIVLTLAGAWQLERGRADGRANHIELSKFLWSGLAIIVAVAGAFVLWVVRAAPAELRDTWTYSSPAGDWFLVEGRMPHRLDYGAAFITNVATGRSVRIPVRDASFNAFTFSRDGKTAAWTHVSNGKSRGGEIWTQRLDPLEPVRHTGINASQFVQVVLSDDGSRVATAAGKLVNIADARTGRSIASARLPLESSSVEMSLFFVTPDVLRLYARQRRAGDDPRLVDLTVPIFELDARTRTLQQTGALRGVGQWMSMAITPDGQRAIVGVFGDVSTGSWLCEADARTGACIGPAAISGRAGDLAALADGSIVHVYPKKDQLILYRAVKGRPMQEIPLGRAYWAYVAACSGMRVVIGAEQADNPERRTTMIVDVATGRIEHVIDNLRPSRHRVFYEDDPRINPAGGHLLAAIDDRGRVVQLDINTGAVTPLPR